MIVLGLFGLFGLTLLGLAVFPGRALAVSLAGLIAIVIARMAGTDFRLVPHLRHEAPLLINLLGLLTGFAVLADHFEASRLPLLMPRWLPDDWKGPFVLLAMVFALSGFLDNIAAALIGGTVALSVFRGRLHTGYLAALVAASNAGGAGSVIGDTTTTMLWISGVGALEVMEAYAGSAAALLFFGYFASRQQDRHQRIQAREPEGVGVDKGKLAVVAAILVGAVAANLALDFPAAGVWAAILAGMAFTGTRWQVLAPALKGAGMLLALVLCASLMPVDRLPAASWHTTLGLGFLSGVFDNIPLTRLALLQGGYDWGFVAYAVGLGGSMMWFGSSAGVALAGIFPQARSVDAWCRSGWHVAVGYVLGFLVMLACVGWHPRAVSGSAQGAPPAGSED